jgi:hypothetical protein
MVMAIKVKFFSKYIYMCCVEEDVKMVRWEAENIILINGVTNDAQYFRHLYLLYLIMILFEGLENGDSVFLSHVTQTKKVSGIRKCLKEIILLVNTLWD